MTLKTPSQAGPIPMNRADGKGKIDCDAGEGKIQHLFPLVYKIENSLTSFFKGDTDQWLCPGFEPKGQ